MTKTSSSLLGFAIAVIASLSIIGCGGGASEGTVSKAAFVKQADAICSAALKSVKSEIKAGADDLAASIATALSTEVQGIEALPLPAGEDGEVEAMLVPIRQAIVALEADKNKSTEEADRLLVPKAEKLADAYGLESCWLS